jgi:shikimate kinase
LIIALIGPPGSGKTYLGHLIHSSLGCAFSETERDLIERYGSLEEFLKHKPAALAELERELRSRAESSPVPLVIESTGLSDGPMLDRLRRDFPLLLVKVWAPRDQCVERVRDREPGRNLNNDPEATAQFYDFWVREVEPRFEFDLALVNDGRCDSEVLLALSGLLSARAQGRGHTSP